MATQILGSQLDIHCGGVDNIFPHHEAEIAQTEGVTGKQFVRYWLHCAHLLVDGQKMSKSAGNFYTLRDVLERGYSGREVRYALLRVHYRAQLNFTWEGMDEARQALIRIDGWLARLHESSASVPLAHSSHAQAGRSRYFEEALDDDLNISAALGVLFEAIRETNRTMDQGTLSSSAAQAWLEWWKQVDSVLAISAEKSLKDVIPIAVHSLAEARVQARLAKDWRKSDELRDQLAALGWDARDTKDGQKVTPRGGA